MSDPVGDLREVVRRSVAPGLKADILLRKIDKLAADFKRVAAKPSQADFCREVAKDGLGAGIDAEEWMFRLCVSRLVRGIYSDWTGWEFRNAWATSSYRPDVETPRWRLEPIKSLAVLGEQGIGDEVMFAGCLVDVYSRGIAVTYECDPRLVNIVERSMPVRAKGRADITARGDPVTKYLTAKREEDAFLPAGDLPRLFRKSLAAFPRVAFLKPLPEKVEQWAHLRGRTGIAWRSRTGQMDPKEFRVNKPVCLQYDAWDYETEGMEVPGCDLRNDIEDILGICANLERVVTVPQTIVHLAGAIGARVEVVIPKAGTSRVLDQFRWRYTDPMPWYPNVKVFESLHAWR